MNDPSAGFCVVRVDPVDCIRRGWDLVKTQYWLFLGICAVGLLIGSVAPLGILLGPMMCGIYLCYLRVLRGEPIEFATLFKGFDHFAQSVIATLILMAVLMVIMIPCVILMFVPVFGLAVTGSNGGSEAVFAYIVFAVLFLFVAVIAMLVSVLFTFTYPLIVDRGLSGVDAVKASSRAVWANLWGTLGLTLLSGLMSFAGVCLCYVGMFFILPVQFGALVIAYRKVFPDPE